MCLLYFKYMDVQAFISDAMRLLSSAGIATARLDCLVLLEDVLHTDRTQLLAHQDQRLTGEQIKTLQAAIDRRAKHEPLAYIRGKSEFYGHVFKVSPDTLEPRPETETLVTMFLDWYNKTGQNKLRVVDVGTGSGAIAISVSLAAPVTEVHGTDLSSAALKIAHQNAKSLQTEVIFHEGDLIHPLPPSIDQPTVLLCNLPYVPDGHAINQAATHEPAIAIFGGPDGLDLYRKLFKQIEQHNKADRPIAIFTESLPFQHHGLAAIARQYGYVQEEREDFIQRFAAV